ncbi:hypothetical protein BHQ15_06600 [Mycolicibacillus koreensis]|nr:hypothetical protein BHQ15_06600 [Mycolicibacillus koreensis]
MSVRQVVVRSRLNQRYVYQEFGSLDGMLQASFDVAFAELFEYLQALAQEPPASVEAGAAVLARAVCAFIEHQPHKARLILVDSLKVASLAARRRDAIQDIAEAYYQFLNRWVEDGKHTRDDLMLVSRFLVGATGEVIIGTLDQSIPGSPADHVDVLARLFADTLRQFERLSAERYSGATAPGPQPAESQGTRIELS